MENFNPVLAELHSRFELSLAAEGELRRNKNCILGKLLWDWALKKNLFVYKEGNLFVVSNISSKG